MNRGFKIKNSRYKIVYLLFFLTISKVHAQVNYVLNPSLEQYTQCPNGPDQINYAKYWSCIDSADTHQSPTDGSPEYINACAGNNTLVGVPNSSFGHAYPRTGNGMASVLMYDTTTVSFPYQRDYLQGRLYKKLTADTSYCVSFYVFVEQTTGYANNHIGAYLDGGQIDTTTSPGLPQTRYTPQILENSVILDTIHWTKIEGSFTATGNERFITIGTFFDDAHLSVVHFNPLGLSDFVSYYFVDDISVVASNTPAYAGGTFFKAKQDSVFIGRNEIVPDCAWYRNGVLVDTVHAGFWVKDTVATTYVVKQSICGNVKWDTAHIYIAKLSAGSVERESGVRLYPNPGNGTFMVHGSMSGTAAQITVMNAIGQIIYSTTAAIQNNTVDAQVSLNNAAPGLYLVRVSNESESMVLRMEVEK